MASKDYILDVLNNRKVRFRRFPLIAPLFFVKQDDKLRGVIDYCALNPFTKSSNTLTPRSEKMFNRLKQAV